jgi:cystathionine beta-lyase
MFFLCNPHNPVGRVWPREDLSRVAEICLRNEVIIVADELHGDITYPGHPYTPLASLGSDAARNSITCLSPAKSFNIAGCCSAFTIVPDENLRKVLQAENSRLTVNKNNAFASVAMEAAYAHGAPWLDAVVAYLGTHLNLIEAYLAEVDGVALINPEGTFLAWLDFRALGLSADALTVFLREKAGWAITRGISFGPTGAGFARLNFACPRSRLDAALHDLSQAVRIR